ncbi:MAG: MotA/TolQ/ExbB proton channel family protein [Myxococcota bacterium]
MRRPMLTVAALTLATLSTPAQAGEPAGARAQAPSTALVDAYKKEYAFLEAEKEALQARLRELERTSRRRIAREEAALAAMQEEVLSTRAEADRLEERLAALKREGGHAEDEDDRVLETLERARETLLEAGVSLPEPPEDAAGRVEELKTLVAGAADLLGERSRILREPGSFFLNDGGLVEGELIHLGPIATFGVSDDASGALAPAGAGKLRLWHADASETARALAAGEQPETLRMFVYEDPDRAVSHKPPKTPREIVESGGLIAWVIVGLGALAALLVVVRALMLTWYGVGVRRVARRVADLVGRGHAAEALEHARRARGAVGRVMRTTVANLHRERATLEDLVSEALLAETPRIERFGSAITVFAAVAPLLGLLGTVTGMISTFDVITEHGTGDPKLLSGGISEALVTTELGLVVAIPTLLLGTLLSGRANQVQILLERGALRVLNEARLCPHALAEPSPEPAAIPTEDDACTTSSSSSISSETRSPAAAS